MSYPVVLLERGLFVVVCMLFFFKRNTEYGLRISDWSSDVCSSDLRDLISDGFGPKKGRPKPSLFLDLNALLLGEAPQDRRGIRRAARCGSRGRSDRKSVVEGKWV